MSEQLKIDNQSVTLESIDKITERTSKKESYEMKRQLELMMNRIKMLEIYKQKCEQRVHKTEQKQEQFQSIRNQYIEYVKQQNYQKESRNKAISEFREKNKNLKQIQKSFRMQLREGLQQQRKHQFETIKKESEINEQIINDQKQRAKSFNVEKRNKIQQLELQCQQSLEHYRCQKQEQFKNQHKNVVLQSFRQKADALSQLKILWEKENAILDQLNDSCEMLKNNSGYSDIKPQF